jgi:hypothetical protein
MHNPIEALAAHMAAQPYYTLTHDMDALYCITVTAYSASQLELWQATIPADEAVALVADARALFDGEGLLCSADYFEGLLQRLTTEWIAMCNPMPPHPVCSRQQAVDLLAAHVGKRPVTLSIDGIEWSVA